MKTILLLSIIAFLTNLPTAAQTAKSAAKIIEEQILRVEGATSLNLKTADLAKLPRRTLKLKDRDGKEVEYEGVELREILKLAGAKIGGEQLRGKELANVLLVEAADNYRTAFTLAEIDAEFTDKIILLAEKRDGKPLSEKEGRWQIIVPDDKKRGRWVRQVTALKIKTVQ